MQIIIPDKLLLSKIQTKNLFYDINSIEAVTGRERNKYKLAGNIITGVYTFFVTYSDDAHCKKHLTLTIPRSDWHNALTGYLKKPYSYIDLSKKVEVFGEAELLLKLRDTKNGFPFIACLCDKKYEELEDLRNKMPRGYELVDTKANLVDLALGDLQEAQRLVGELGLA